MPWNSDTLICICKMQELWECFFGVENAAQAVTDCIFTNCKNYPKLGWFFLTKGDCNWWRIYSIYFPSKTACIASFLIFCFVGLYCVCQFKLEWIVSKTLMFLLQLEWCYDLLQYLLNKLWLLTQAKKTIFKYLNDTNICSQFHAV